jgi:hypothetical protein
MASGRLWTIKAAVIALTHIAMAHMKAMMHLVLCVM